jgi:Trehalase
MIRRTRAVLTHANALTRCHNDCLFHAQAQARAQVHHVHSYTMHSHPGLDCVQAYYLNRSQPPLLGAMLELLLDAQPAVDLSASFLASAARALQSELLFWTSAQRRVCVQDGSGGRQRHLCRYVAAWSQPRPESFR